MIDLQRPLLNTPLSSAHSARPSSSVAAWAWSKRWMLVVLVTLLAIVITARQAQVRSAASSLRSTAPIFLAGGRPLLDYDDGGIARTIQRKGTLGDHPILELIQRGRDLAVKHAEIRDGISSLEDAVADYRAAFGMNPPVGFEQWSLPAQSSC